MRSYKSLEWDRADSFQRYLDKDRTDLIEQIAANYILSNKKNVLIAGMNLWGDGLIRVHGKLNKSSNNNNSKFRIPIISNESECCDEIKNKISAQISSCCNYLRQCIKRYPLINFIWVTAPAVPEMVARLRFGDEYVDSGSQLVYNQIYFTILQSISNELELDSNILLSDNNSLTSTGFLMDQYANLSTSLDIHASPAFYTSQVFPRCKFIQ